MREFRLPTKDVRESLTFGEKLKKILKSYSDWYFQNEESMTFSEADSA